MGLNSLPWPVCAVQLDKVLGAITNDDTYKLAKGFYVFVYSRPKGVVVAHGGNSSFMGLDINEVLASIGVVDDPTLQGQLDTAAANGGEWVVYNFRHTWEKVGVEKASWVTGVSVLGKDYLVGVGYSNVDRNTPTPVTTSTTATATTTNTAGTSAPGPNAKDAGDSTGW